ncbi:MAG: hypothetical protein ABIF11_07620 [Nitrospirota bacterium]
MEYKRLYVFVEGQDDKNFFEKIIKPKFEKEYNEVKVELYAEESFEWRRKYIRSIRKIKAADYIYVADINNAPCVTAKKQKIKNIDKDKIIVVIKEIEGWYLAGLDDTNSKRLKIPTVTTTDTITKEQFNRLISKNSSRINCMLEILKCFSLKIAWQKNTSFNYFVEKYKIKGEGKTEN